MPSASEGRSSGQSLSSRGAGSRRRAESDTGSESEYTVELSARVAEAMSQLAARLNDPGIVHSMSEIDEITQGFSTTTEAMSQGLVGITEQLRAAGYAGPLSGHASVVADRLAHAGRELTRLAETVQQAQSDES